MKQTSSVWVRAIVSAHRSISLPSKRRHSGRYARLIPAWSRRSARGLLVWLFGPKNRMPLGGPRLRAVSSPSAVAPEGVLVATDSARSSRSDGVQAGGLERPARQRLTTAAVGEHGEPEVARVAAPPGPRVPSGWPTSSSLGCEAAASPAPKVAHVGGFASASRLSHRPERAAGARSFPPEGV
jgi:hypothetical protein